MSAIETLSNYRAIGPFLTMIAVSFVLGFVGAFAGFTASGFSELAGMVGVVIGGLWWLTGASYEVYEGVKRHRGNAEG